MSSEYGTEGSGGPTAFPVSSVLLPEIGAILLMLLKLQFDIVLTGHPLCQGLVSG